MEKRRVVITGLGTVNPLGNNVADSWAAARAGKCGIGPITQFDTTDFKCKLAGEVKDFDPETVVDKKEVRKMARFTLLALGAAAEAIADSGIDTEAEGKNIGVILSSGIGGIGSGHPLLCGKASAYPSHAGGKAGEAASFGYRAAQVGELQVAVGVHHAGEEQPRVKLGAGHPVGLPPLLHSDNASVIGKGHKGALDDPPTVKEEAGGYPAQRLGRIHRRRCPVRTVRGRGCPRQEPCRA